MSTQATAKPFWQSTNFWTTTALLVGGLFVGFPDGEARTAVGLIFAIMASVGAIRERLKTSTLGWKAWISNKNTWAYLGVIVTAIVPILPGELFQHFGTIAEAAIGGNYQGILVGLFSAIPIIYNLFIKKNPPPPAP